MIVAVAEMDPMIRMLFFLVAVVLFVLAALGREPGPVGLMPAGLAFFAFPFMWDALAAT